MRISDIPLWALIQITLCQKLRLDLFLNMHCNHQSSVFKTAWGGSFRRFWGFWSRPWGLDCGGGGLTKGIWQARRNGIAKPLLIATPQRDRSDKEEKDKDEEEEEEEEEEKR